MTNKYVVYCYNKHEPNIVWAFFCQATDIGDAILQSRDTYPGSVVDYVERACFNEEEE